MPQTTTRLAAALTLLTTAAAAHAQTRVVYVDQTAPAGGDGTSWQRAFNDLQAALTRINALPWTTDLEVRVAHGTYHPRTVDNLGRGFRLNAPTTSSGLTIAIRGSFLGRGSPTPDVQDFVAARTVLSAALPAGSATPRATSSLALTNEASNGPASIVEGIELVEAADLGLLCTNFLSFTVRHCHIHDIAGQSVGGVLVSAPVPSRLVLIENTTVERCSGSAAGAISAGNARVYIMGSRIIDNTGTGPFSVGAIGSQEDLVVDRTTIAGNVGRSTGGIEESAWHVLFLSNSLVAANRGGNAGGIYAGGVLCTNTTFVQNSGEAAGAARVSVLSWWPSLVSLTNCIFARNSASQPSAPPDASINADFFLFRSRINLSLTNGSTAEGGTLQTPASEILAFDPLFVDPSGPDHDPGTWADNDYRLRPESPAIDAGANLSSAYLTDIAGLPRVVPHVLGRYPTIDLGCYESQLTLCPADITADQAVTVDDLLAFVEAYAAGGWLADLTTDGASPQPDGAVTIDDLLYFLARFEGGC